MKARPRERSAHAIAPATLLAAADPSALWPDQRRFFSRWLAEHRRVTIRMRLFFGLAALFVGFVGALASMLAPASRRAIPDPRLHRAVTATDLVSVAATVPPVADVDRLPSCLWILAPSTNTHGPP